VAGVWVGNDDSSPMRNVTGGTLPASIWKQVMTQAEAGLPGKLLAKSSPPAETDETSVADSGDDESGTVSASEPAPVEQTDRTAPGEPATSQPSFWDWMFGRGSAAPPPPQQEQPSQQEEQPSQQQQQQGDQDQPADPPQSTPPPPPDGPPPPPPPGIEQRAQLGDAPPGDNSGGPDNR